MRPTSTRRLIRFAELKAKGVSTNAALRAAGIRSKNTRWAMEHPVVRDTLAALNPTDNSEERFE